MLNLNFKYIDPRLVLEFVPETSAQSEQSPQNPYPLQDFLVNGLQIFDCAQAFHYIEQEMIPFLKKQKTHNFKDVTPEQIINWIKGIHQVSAKMLAKDHAVTAGEYSPGTVIRWHKSTLMEGHILAAIQSANNFTAVDFTSAFEPFGLGEYASSFKTLLARIEADDSIEEKEHARPLYMDQMNQVIKNLNLTEEECKSRLSEKIIQYDRSLHKLLDAYHQKKLTEAELEVVNAIFSICLPPEEIPGAVEKFANEFIKRLRSCTNELPEITDLCTFAFQQITKIHPFFNGNGRTATSFLIALLVVFDQPSVLLRTSKDKNNQNSEYSIAVKNLNNKPKIFRDYLKKLIKQKDHRQLDKKRLSGDDELLRKKCEDLTKLVNLAIILNNLKEHNLKSKAELQKMLMDKIPSLNEMPTPSAQYLPSQMRSSATPPALSPLKNGSAKKRNLR